MRIVDIDAAKTHLDSLVEGAAHGEPFGIAVSGTPMVKVTAIESPSRTGQRRLGFLEGEIRVPVDFDQMGREEIVVSWVTSDSRSLNGMRSKVRPRTAFSCFPAMQPEAEGMVTAAAPRLKGVRR